MTSSGQDRRAPAGERSARPSVSEGDDPDPDPALVPDLDFPTIMTVEPAAERRKGHRHRHRRPTPRGGLRGRRRRTPKPEDLAVAMAAAAAAAAAVVAPGEPTVLAPVNVALRVALAVVVTLATARARRWSWLVLAGLAAGASGLGVDAGDRLVAAATGWQALVIAAVVVVADVRQRWLGAVVGALAVSSLMRLGSTGPLGSTAALAGVAVVPVLWSAYRLQPRRRRRGLRRGAAAVLAASAVAGLGAAVAALVGFGPAESGMASARAGVTAAKAGDEAAAGHELHEASDSFQTADRAFDAWYARPALAVPVLSQQVRAAERMATTGRELSTVASDVAGRADYRHVALADGRVDLARVAALEGPLSDVRAAIDRARSSESDVGTDWLVPPIRGHYDELTGDVADADRETALALDAVRVAPGLLGAHGPRRYFVAFTTPAESRGLGGFMGNWAELTAEDGRLALTRSERVATLDAQPGEAPRTLAAPADYVARYGANRPEKLLQDVTLSPDFPSVAAALTSLYPQTRGGRPIDGVIALDPYTVAAMLRLTGPVSVPGADAQLTADNAADFLLRRQYVELGNQGDRVDYLDEASRRAFDAFLHHDGLQPDRVASTLGPLVGERRLLLHSNHDDEQRLLDRLGAGGAFPAPDGGDFFAVVTQNGGNNKIDTFLHRAVDYHAEWNPETGAVEATATVTLRNDAPASGLPSYVIANRPQSLQPDGANWLWFNFYTPHELTEMRVDGAPVLVGAAHELGRHVYHRYVAVPSQGTTVIRLKLRGTVAAGATYRASWFQQPLVHPDRVTVSAGPSGPWHLDAAAAAGSDPTAVAADGTRDGATTILAARDR
jgi:hypothetical protein